ncbi:TPR-like protein [Ascobolus immersus RN42]|uniref:protein O-GlcNAc transferase n=1 Tax=Ascobolus immersus RN42 TaxID=1160509 RepID=A0A3N4HEQ9_ASCIM|nr:TPR-like protein [Ascobolus immersus RN42]
MPNVSTVPYALLQPTTDDAHFPPDAFLSSVQNLNPNSRRDAIFSWAHRVYAALLESQQKTQRIGRANSVPHIKTPKRAVTTGVPDSYFPRPAYQALRKQSFQGPASPSSPYPQQRFSALGHGPTPYDAAQGAQGQRTGYQQEAKMALKILEEVCAQGGWKWLDGMLIAGCLAYGLSDLVGALGWYGRILERDGNHVEAMSNLASTLFCLERLEEAEEYWKKAVRKRPGFFEAVEHLVSLLCGQGRMAEAVGWIGGVQKALRRPAVEGTPKETNTQDSAGSLRSPAEKASKTTDSPASSVATTDTTSSGDTIHFDYYQDDEEAQRLKTPRPQVTTTTLQARSPYNIPPNDTPRMLNLLHAKANMLYNLTRTPEAASAFEDAVLLAVGGHQNGLSGLVQRIINTLSTLTEGVSFSGPSSTGAVLLTPSMALKTAELVFPPHGELPGLMGAAGGKQGSKAARSTTSNALLSLAKIWQDGMFTGGSKGGAPTTTPGGVRDILALYYLSLSLHPSPSTANNVGILLANVQQVNPIPRPATAASTAGTQPPIPVPGVVPGSGVDLALHYYHFGLQLDPGHAHLYTNLGSLLKDLDQLPLAVKMYEKAVTCDPSFDIALANLANAVKDQGRVEEAVEYYRRAVRANPEFAEAVCGLGGGLGSICAWVGRGGVGVKDGVCVDRWHVDEGGMLVDALAVGGGRTWGVTRALQWRWYHDRRLGRKGDYTRPQFPATVPVPTAPTVLPFHTFTCPLTAQQVRQISQRNGIRISCSTLRSPWLPKTVYPPPNPPDPVIHVGYVSSDFNNHPLAHLMQSVFGFHDTARVKAHCYATTPSDGSPHRHQIEREAPVFVDASAWTPAQLIQRILDDGIHILVNLNGFTRGARNEVFAARPAPILMSFMGFAGTLGAEWCDYLLADTTTVPVSTVRPWRRNVVIKPEEVVQETEENAKEGWVYAENVVFTKHSFFCNDHRQSAPDAVGPRVTWEEEVTRRWKMRKELFPDIADDTIILANFNQLYKLDPTTYRTWIRILTRVPNAVLWLLRFPETGEKNLLHLARLWGGEEVAKRVRFTAVARKEVHISRGKVADLFLDTGECGGHTTAADVLWGGTPVVTGRRWRGKMCSRVAASLVGSAFPRTGPLAREAEGMAGKMVVGGEEEYERRVVELCKGMRYVGEGRAMPELMRIRKVLFEGRWESELFDTRRWVRDLEGAYERVWRGWEEGGEGDVFLDEGEEGRYGGGRVVGEDEE